MNNNLKNIEFVFPETFNLDHFLQMKPEEPFSENAISFLNALAVLLRNDPESNDFPELVTFAFYLRKRNLIQLKNSYYPENNTRTGRGIVFHITPSNMSVNFAYSLVSGILSGNLNVVRLPSVRFKQADIICRAIKSLCGKSEFQLFAQRMLLVRYDKLNSATAFFSAVCDVRIIWGGDPAIQEIKKSSLSATATDVTFSDKYSLCVINANKYIHEISPEEIAQSFYNDTFIFNQNACTSPHLIVWLGSDKNIEESKRRFWANLYELVKKKYYFHSYSAIEKLLAFCNHAIHSADVKKTTMPDNLIWRIELNELSDDLDRYRCNCGYFAEYKASSLTELSGIISKKHQIIACYGIEEKDWNQFSEQTNLNIKDRLRSIGKTSEFSLNWDGYNLIETLSRQSNMDSVKTRMLNP